MSFIHILIAGSLVVAAGSLANLSYHAGQVRLDPKQVEAMSKPVNVRVDGPINTTPASTAPQAPIYVIVVPQAPAPVPEAKPKPARSKPPEKILTIRHPEPSDEMRRFYDRARRGDLYALPRQY